ncbi:ABC transporter permease, partial [Escherichia coli]|nr:ABC transporter permease [Escherichia coli]
IWQLASSLKWIDPLIFSSPLRVWNLFIEKTGDGSLLEHIGFTLFETVLGFIIGTLCGIILATLLWYSNRLAKVLDPYL